MCYCPPLGAVLVSILYCRGPRGLVSCQDAVFATQSPEFGPLTVPAVWGHEWSLGLNKRSARLSHHSNKGVEWGWDKKVKEGGVLGIPQIGETW